MRRSGKGIRLAYMRVHKSNQRTNLSWSTLYLKLRSCETKEPRSRERRVEGERVYRSLLNLFMNRYLMRRRSWRRVKHWMRRVIGITYCNLNQTSLDKGHRLLLWGVSLEITLGIGVLARRLNMISFFV